jgi:two-component system phosphate regulon sensor histidine kinase PhoR
MKKIFLKAMRLANKRLFFEFNKQDSFKDSIFETENPEFLELEQYLDQIKRKLKERREQIAHGYEESKTLMSAIEEAVVNVDKNEYVLFFNSAFASQFVPRMTLNENDDQIKIPLSQIFRDHEILNLFDKAIHQGQSGKIQKSIISQIDSRERIFSLSVSPLKDQKTNEVFEVMGIFHDISELKWAEKIRTEFVENASHELKTPLTSIMGYLEIIKEDIQSGNSKNTLENILIVNKSVHRLNALVDGLLTLSKLEHGEHAVMEKIKPEVATEEVIQKLNPLAKQKNIQIHVKNHGVQTVHADVTKLEQVLSNLIENGIKYNRDHGIVEIHWHPQAEGCKLIVKDNGPGIANHHQERLFERFYRVDRARSREIGGTGLGLSIVKHIMNIHGGSVSVKSDVGLGTEFTCIFP